MQAPKEKRNEQMSLAHRKYFVNFITKWRKLQIFPGGIPSYIQEDLSVFGTLKNQYSSWLMRKTLVYDNKLLLNLI